MKFWKLKCLFLRKKLHWFLTKGMLVFFTQDSIFQVGDEQLLRSLFCNSSAGIFLQPNHCFYYSIAEVGDRKFIWGPQNNFTMDLKERFATDLGLLDNGNTFIVGTGLLTTRYSLLNKFIISLILLFSALRVHLRRKPWWNEQLRRLALPPKQHFNFLLRGCIFPSRRRNIGLSTEKIKLWSSFSEILVYRLRISISSDSRSKKLHW